MKTFGLSCIVFAGITLIAPQALFATEKDELETLQKEVDQLKKQFESQTTPATSQSSFNPAISLILMGRYAAFDNDPEDYAIPGISLADETGPGPEGFSMGESELVISANVDNMFFGRFTTALTPENEVEIEEALVQTLALPAGLTAQFGRFYSDIGYLNSNTPINGTLSINRSSTVFILAINTMMTACSYAGWHQRICSWNLAVKFSVVRITLRVAQLIKVPVVTPCS